MLNPDKGILFLRNHKCASTTCIKILGEYFPIKGVKEKDSNIPWTHTFVDGWMEYINENKLKGKYLITFTTVRNPWDRMVSLFYYEGSHSKTYGKNGFKNFIKTFNYKFKNFIFDENGCKKVDVVVKIEELDNLFTILSKLMDINIDQKNQKLKLNVSKRPDRKNRDYRQYYDDETKKIVGEMFKYEIEYFDYKF